MAGNQNFTEIKCKNCGQFLTDPRNAHLQPDVTTGGWLGVHKACPADAVAAAPAPQSAELYLLLTTARILHSLLLEQPSPFCDFDRDALTDALAPFQASPQTTQPADLGPAAGTPRPELKIVEKDTA